MRKLDPDEQKVLDDVRDHGCQVMHIVAEDDAPAFSFSIGFPTSVGQPEVIVFGLRREMMHFMVNEVRSQCAEGSTFADGMRISGLIEGFDCIVRHITNRQAIEDHFGWAIWYHRSQLGTDMADAYQIVWPGAQQGLFPWEPDCHEDVIACQPALYQTSLNS